MQAMIDLPPDLAQRRLSNALALFDEFVRAAARKPDAATLRGLERRFAERLGIAPSYWSQIKGRVRQIGERLARQFERAMHKPYGWLDQEHGQPGAATSAVPASTPSPTPAGAVAMPPSPAPAAWAPDGGADPAVAQNDDERFIVGLVLSYYRRHPQRARTRLLDLLSEVLSEPLTPPHQSAARAATRAAAPPAMAEPGTAAAPGLSAGAPADGEHALWQQAARGVAPLKPKRSR